MKLFLPLRGLRLVRPVSAAAWLLGLGMILIWAPAARASAIVAAEYFVGADPGEGSGTPVAVTGPDGQALDLPAITIPVGSLPAGTHEVGLRVKDDQNRWSNPLRRRFTIRSYTIAGGQSPDAPNVASSFPSPVKALVAAEYFVGADPGEGNGTALTLGDSDALSRAIEQATLSVNGLGAGTYDVGVRVRDEAGRWSNPLRRRFTVRSYTLAGGKAPDDPNLATSFAKPVKPLVEAEFFVGPDPGPGAGVPLALGPDGVVSHDLAQAQIALTMPAGTYDVGVRVKDEAGRWSNALRRRFTLYRSEVTAAQRAGTKLVDLTFDLRAGARPYTVVYLISNDGGLTWTVPTGSVTGAAGSGVAGGQGLQAVWHAGEDWNNGFSEDMRFRVVAYETGMTAPAGFASVAPGPFSMGSPAGEIGRAADEPTRSVTRARPVFLKTTETTWAEWQAVRGQGAASGYTDIAAGRNGLNGDGSGNHPVTEVSWMDVVKWCNLRSELEGRKPVYYSSATLNPATVVRTGIPTVHANWNANGYRLPTEAEWEAACRAGSTTAFHNGAITNATADPILDTAGWYAANSGGNTWPVGSKPANSLGLFDTHGNVREWCWDAYAAYAAGPQWDPTGPAAGSARVLRGGGWNSPASACRSAARSSSGQNSRATDIGFRLALNGSGLSEISTTSGIAVDSRDPAPGNLVAGLRPQIDGDILATVTLPDGKILVAGDFFTVDGQSRPYLARLLANGQLDPEFDASLDYTVRCLAVQADGRILVGGDFASAGGGPANYLARLLPNGALDTGFAPNVDSTVQCVAVQADGRILIGGSFYSVASTPRSALARLLPNGSLDPDFAPDPDGPVTTVAVQPDGRILAAGSFMTIAASPRDRIARLTSSGTIDPAFNPAADDEVTAMAVQADGRILLGGAFSTVAGQARAGLARLTSTGTLDSTFNPGVTGRVYSLALQADSRIIVAGDFNSIAGQPRSHLARLNSNGTLDSAVAPAIGGPVRSVSLLGDGRLVLAGSFASIGGVTRHGIAWLDNTAPTQTLSAPSSNRARWLRGGAAPEAQLVTFDLSIDNGQTWRPLGAGTRISGGWEKAGVNLPAQGLLRGRARVSGGLGNASSGVVEASVTFSGLLPIPEIDIEGPNSTPIADGGSLSFGNVAQGFPISRTLVIRNTGFGALTGLTITKDGSHPGDFSVLTSPAAPVPGPDGITTLTVEFSPNATGPRSAALHIASNDTNETPYDIQLTGTGVTSGAVAGSFAPNLDGLVSALAVQPDGKILIGGTFTTVDGVARPRLARLLPDGTLESTATFNPGTGPNGQVLAIAVQSDGKILIGGEFTTVNSQTRNRLARLNPDGSLESNTTFSLGTGVAGQSVTCLAVQPDAKILVGGSFSSINGQPRGNLARLNPNGSVEGTATFNLGSGPNDIVYTLATQPDGRILIGGFFTEVNGNGRGRFARLEPNGTVESLSTFKTGTGANAFVSAIAVQADGRILLGGGFNLLDGHPRNNIARLKADGALEPPQDFLIGNGANGVVQSIALQADGRALVSGMFTTMDSQPRGFLARLLPNGSVESTTTFNTGTGANNSAFAVALQGDGSVIVGGEFTAFNGDPHSRLARLFNQTAIESLTAPSSSRVEWLRDGAAPELTHVEFHHSSDAGVSWSALGSGQRRAGGWELTGLNLPTTGQIRARGRTAGGYTTGSSGLIESFTSFQNPPVAELLNATSVTADTAVLQASVVANGSATAYFEYGTSPAYGTTTAHQPVSGGVPAVFSASVSGLAPLTAYHYRVVITNAAGTAYGPPTSFITLADPPSAITANPSAVTVSSATLAAAVNPRGRPTTAYFQYGTTQLYGNTTSPQSLGSASTPIEVTASLAGLIPQATYNYRIVAESPGGITYGENVSFVATSGGGSATAAPSIGTVSATELTTTGATLGGAVNPNGGFTNAFFEYGTTTSYGGVSSALGAGNGSVPVNVSAAITGLTPGTLYHYRLVASNSVGTTQGADGTFTTNFLPPVAVTGGATALSTTSARVTGTVRARNASTQAVFDYGTDGVSFPNSVNATPGTVTGDAETTVTADLPNLQGGVTYHYRLRAVSSGGTTTGAVATFMPAILSGLAQVFPAVPPPADGAITVTLTPGGLATGWRLVGEQTWRASGTTAGQLVTGDREIEFRPLPGWIQPPRETVGVVSGNPPVVLDREYFESTEPGTGGLSVVLKPESLAAPSVPASTRAQWRLTGESDAQWKDTGASLGGLPAGNYLVEAKPVAGRVTPPPTTVIVLDGQTTLATMTYQLADALTGAAPIVVPFTTTTTTPSLPYAYVGQIRSDAGLSSGFVVKPRVVATAAHVVWDDGTLAPATGLQWLFQRDQGTFEPKPLIPRGFYIFDGYAAQRTAENSPGSSSPQSQNLDVAALYFNEDAGRGGFAGFLASDLDANEFLLSSYPKRLVGYPVDGIAPALHGRLHASAPFTDPLTPAFGRTWTTTAIRSSGGNSGGPLCIEHPNGKSYPAAIYLGGSAQTVVRAIDSTVIDLFNRAEVSGNGGQNNTGGGITHTSVSTIGASSNPGAIKVVLEPAAARAAGAGWRLSPEASYRASGSQRNNLSPGNYALQLRLVPGFQAPANQAVRINGGQLSSLTFTYAPAVSPIESWRQTHFATTSNSGSAADTADPDSDSLSNLVEFAFGLNPTTPSVHLLPSWQKTGTVFSLAFTVPSGVSGVTYVVEYSTSPTGGPWIAIPNSGTATQRVYSFDAGAMPRAYVRYRVTTP